MVLVQTVGHHPHPVSPSKEGEGLQKRIDLSIRSGVHQLVDAHNLSLWRSNMLDITDASFDSEVLDSSVPVLVEFWSTWCASCKQQEQVMQEMAAEYGDRVRFGKVKIEENQNLAIRHTVMSAPTLLLFAGGELKRRFNGFQKRATLAAAIDSVLA
jgi:thioredoxin 1